MPSQHMYNIVSRTGPPVGVLHAPEESPGAPGARGAVCPLACSSRPPESQVCCSLTLFRAPLVSMHVCRAALAGLCWPHCLRRVLSELDKHNMVWKPTKASLFVKEVEFAGHVVGHGQRRPMPGKLASLHHWEKPQTISELRSFMGFCNYYSGYVRMFAELSGPLHKMLQVGKFDGRKWSKKKLDWTLKAEDAFNRLKEGLLEQLGLFLVDLDKGFVLRREASDYAVGAVLEQIRDDGSHVPVTFSSRILVEGQRRTWTAREKETYAIVCALRKWSGHIGLQLVVVCTDHQSLQSWRKEHVDTPSGPAARRARWHETFAKFDLSVVYVPGKDNTVADCLS